MASSIERARAAREHAQWAYASRAWCDHRPTDLSATELAFHAFEVDPAWYEAYRCEEGSLPPAGVGRRVVGWLFGRIRAGIGLALAGAAGRIGRIGTHRADATGVTRPIGSIGWGAVRGGRAASAAAPRSDDQRRYTASNVASVRPSGASSARAVPSRR